MPLLAFWNSNPDAVGQLNIEQVVSNAGEGVLKDQTACSLELRAYLGEVPTERIATYVNHCLNAPFQKSGMVLQDLVNELGRRLDYIVVNGRYQGVVNAIGYDGIWNSPENHSLVVEVKTTDTYRLSLDNLARYRERLLDTNEINALSSILIVVGREDTGELEAQIRGSRHAWDVRVISAEALIKLVVLKENSEAMETGLKIRSLLTPVEYTRLDRMIDVMFTTVTDVDDAPTLDVASDDDNTEIRPSTGNSATKVRAPNVMTDGQLLQSKRESVIAALGHREHVALVRKSRALYWSPQHHFRVACSISKRYSGKNQQPYWYAYHPTWDEFLAEAEIGFFVLGCMDRSEAFAIPRAVILNVRPHLHTTTKDGKTYWHIHLLEREGGVELLVPGSIANMPLEPYRIDIS